MLVSILIPIYNSAPWLERCLNSIIYQSYENLEIILYNDGSTDESLNICRKFQKSDSRIRIITDIKNHGIGYARHQLVTNINGSAFMFIDSDDWIEPDTIETLALNLSNHNLDICACSMYFDSNHQNLLINATNKGAVICGREEMISHYLKLSPLHGSLCNKLIRTALIKNIHFHTDWVYAEDSDYVWNLLQNVNHYELISTPLYHYCIRKGSLSYWQFNISQLTFIESWRKITSDVQEKYPQFLKLAKSSFAQILTSFLRLIIRDKYSDKAVVSYLRNLLGLQYPAFIFASHISLKYKIFSTMSLMNWQFTKFIITTLYE